jgi:hypothetical protein
MTHPSEAPLDILLVESRPGAADDAVAELTGAGHRLHRCHEHGAARFPCAGVLEHDRCPIDQGVDVALLVRREGEAGPTVWEHGVSCALRAGVPVVEDGPAESDPYGEWIAARVDGSGLASTVEVAARRAFDPLVRAIETRTRRLIESAHIAPAEVSWAVESNGHALVIHLDGPRMTRQLEQAIAVRVLDALHSTSQTYGHVDVTFGGAGEPAADGAG